MASSFAQTAVTWPTAQASVTLSSTAESLSEVITLNAETYDAALQVSVDCARGTPVSGDYVDLYLVPTTGDLLGDTGDDYDTSEHAMFLGRLDTYATNTPGEDPARRTYQIPTAPQKFKLRAIAPSWTTGGNFTVRARLEEHKVA